MTVPISRASNMQILLLSDTHGCLHPAILDIAARADIIVHAGDIGHPAIIDQLKLTKARLIAVRGNNDTPGRWPEHRRSELQQLGTVENLELAGGKVSVEHGHRANPASQRHARLRKRHSDSRLIVYGHSHHQIIDQSTDQWIVNPGAAGRHRTFGGSSCVLMQVRGNDWSLRTYRFPLSNWQTQA
jgi:putative phosphoesterase